MNETNMHKTNLIKDSLDFLMVSGTLDISFSRLRLFCDIVFRLNISFQTEKSKQLQTEQKMIQPAQAKMNKNSKACGQRVGGSSCTAHRHTAGTGTGTGLRAQPLEVELLANLAKAGAHGFEYADSAMLANIAEWGGWEGAHPHKRSNCLPLMFVHIWMYA